jgi:hypothetical protein
MYVNTTINLYTHTPPYSIVNEVLSPFTYTDTDDYIIRRAQVKVGLSLERRYSQR